jgi:hypothetical protein
MVEIRRDSLTGNVLDKTVIDTKVFNLGKETEEVIGSLLIAREDDEFANIHSQPKSSVPFIQREQEERRIDDNTEYYDKSKPLPRRGSLKFDYDVVDYGDSSSYVAEDDSEAITESKGRISIASISTEKIGSEIPIAHNVEDDDHLRSVNDMELYAALSQYKLSRDETASKQKTLVNIQRNESK